MPDTVTPGVDSYVSLEDANAIAADRLFSGLWTDADDDTRCAALKTATSFLDRLRWQGRRVAPTQALAWPRVNVNAPDGYPLSPEIPAIIRTATVEFAISLLSQGDLQRSNLQMQQVGSSMMMFFPTIADDLPKHVRRLIEPLLIASSAHVAEVAF